MYSYSTVLLHTRRTCACLSRAGVNFCLLLPSSSSRSESEFCGSRVSSCVFVVGRWAVPLSVWTTLSISVPLLKFHTTHKTTVVCDEWPTADFLSLYWLESATNVLFGTCTQNDNSSKLKTFSNNVRNRNLSNNNINSWSGRHAVCVWFIQPIFDNKKFLPRFNLEKILCQSHTHKSVRRGRANTKDKLLVWARGTQMLCWWCWLFYDIFVRIEWRCVTRCRHQTCLSLSCVVGNVHTFRCVHWRPMVAVCSKEKLSRRRKLFASAKIQKNTFDFNTCYFSRRPSAIAVQFTAKYCLCDSYRDLTVRDTTEKGVKIAISRKHTGVVSSADTDRLV